MRIRVLKPNLPKDPRVVNLKEKICMMGWDGDLNLALYSWHWNDEVSSRVCSGELDFDTWASNTTGFLEADVYDKYPDAIIEIPAGEDKVFWRVDYTTLLKYKTEKNSSRGVMFA